MPNISKEGVKHVSLSTISSLIVLLPVMWLLVKPLIAASLAEDVKATVKQEVVPLNNAFSVMMRRNITELRREIAQMEFRRDQPPEEDWTAEDARELVRLKEDLESSLAALRALQVPSTSP